MQLRQNSCWVLAETDKDYGHDLHYKVQKLISKILHSYICAVSIMRIVMICFCVLCTICFVKINAIKNDRNN